MVSPQLRYTGQGHRVPSADRDGSPSPGEGSLRNHPENYLADRGLVDAVNVALLLKKPLLLSGEPGTGKTQLPYSLAWELGFPPPLKFSTKSVSEARDLFYTYDAIGRFHAAQVRPSDVDPRQFIRFNALGQAIIRASRDAQPWSASGEVPEGGRGRQSVVLIDEIDKAPRDFPNDLLNDIEHMCFQIPEIHNQTIEADPDLKPIVVLTSNSEKHLPDAFLRRCIFYNITFPDADRLREIVRARLPELADRADPLLKSGLGYFHVLREKGRLKKPPATAELLDWLRALWLLRDGTENVIEEKPEAAVGTLCALVKNAEDHRRALDLWHRRAAS